MDDSTTAEPAYDGDDAVLPFQLDALDLRGRVVRLDRTLERILGQHAYPTSVGALVAEATLVTAMIGQAMKLRGKFSLQVRGDGPVSLIATDYLAPLETGAPARLRGYARFDAERTPDLAETPFALLGEGLFAMTIDQGPGTSPYQGLTPLSPEGVAASAEIYFAQSEQIATKFKLALGRAEAPGGARAWRAGGVMIQHLAPMGEGARAPDAPSGGDGLLRASDIAEMSDRAEEWRSATARLETADEIELVGPHVTPEALLYRLFHDVGPRVFAAEAMAFGCTCAPEKIRPVLARYPSDELAELADADGWLHADCQFCGARYSFRCDEIAAEA